MLRALIVRLMQFLVRLRPVVAKGFSRVFMFWRGGLFQWIGMALVVVGDNWAAFKEMVVTASPIPFVISVGENLALSLNRIADALLLLTDSAPEVAFTFFGHTFRLSEAVGVPLLVLVPLVTIGWHYRTIHAGLTFRYGEMIPWHLSFFMGTIILGLVVLIAHFAVDAPLPTQEAQTLMLSFAGNTTGTAQ